MSEPECGPWTRSPSALNFCVNSSPVVPFFGGYETIINSLSLIVFFSDSGKYLSVY